MITLWLWPSADGRCSKCLQWLLISQEPPCDGGWLELTTSALLSSHAPTFPVQDLLTELCVQAGFLVLEELWSSQEEGEGHKEGRAAAWQKLPRCC